MLSFKRLICKINFHHWQYEIRGHTYEGFIYPVSYRRCKNCKLAQVQIMDADSAEVIWQLIEK